MLIPGNATNALPPVPLVPTSAGTTSTSSFSEVLDTINPLQHIPVVSSLYRNLSGTSISAGAQWVGDTLYGLVTGTTLTSSLASAADIAVKQVTGQNITSALTNSLASKAKPSTQALIPDNTAQATPQIKDTPQFFPLDNKNRHIAAGQYSRALALDSVNKKLVKMVS